MTRIATGNLYIVQIANLIMSWMKETLITVWEEKKIRKLKKALLNNLYSSARVVLLEIQAKCVFPVDVTEQALIYNVPRCI